MSGARRGGRGRWVLPAILCAAMLALPVLTWLLVPRTPRFALPVYAAATGAVPADIAPSAAASARGTPYLVRTASAPLAPAADFADGPVTGVVLDPDGRPVKGAFVGCDDRDQTLATSTDEDGAFKLAAEAAGCLAVARLPPFVDSDRTALAAGPSNTLRLNRAGGIEGDVVDERGAPIPAFVIAVESYLGPNTETAPVGRSKRVQDKDGAYLWDHLVPGRYVLTAGTDGRPPAQSRPVDVDVGRVTAHVRITLGRGATLAGRVIDAVTRRPLAGAVVILDAATRTDASGVHPARSDDQGAYTLEGAPSNGPFSVRVTLPGYRARVVTGLTARGGASVQADVELNPAGDGGAGLQDFAGIGAYLAPSSKGMTFAGFLPGGPAAEAGLQPGDLIRRIDGADASSYTAAECMQNLRGPDGTRVSVEVERAGQRVDVTLQRRAITF